MLLPTTNPLDEIPVFYQLHENPILIDEDSTVTSSEREVIDFILAPDKFSENYSPAATANLSELELDQYFKNLFSPKTRTRSKNPTFQTCEQMHGAHFRDKNQMSLRPWTPERLIVFAGIVILKTAGSFGSDAGTNIRYMNLTQTYTCRFAVHFPLHRC